VSLPPDDQARYIGRSRSATQNVLAVCDFDLCFTYVTPGQPRYMHDISALYHAIRVDRDVFPHPPQGSIQVTLVFLLYYLVFINIYNYVQCEWLGLYFKEVLCCWCGLSKSSRIPRPIQGWKISYTRVSQTLKEKFNQIHSSIWNVIERSFGIFKMKWQFLYALLQK